MLQRNVDLTEQNTLRLPAVAEAFLAVSDAAAAAALPNLCKTVPGRRLILGGGSNLVLPAEIPGLVIANRLHGRRLVSEDDTAWLVAAAGGESWHEFVLWTLEQGWPGLENLALIPGTVGAAPIQNIGAYGLEIAERLDHLLARDLKSGDVLRFSAKDCRLGYRDSIFKQEGWHRFGRFLIEEVVFRLPKNWQPQVRYADLAAELERLQEQGIAQPSPQQVAAAVMAVRRRKLPDPATLPNAGSFFQNPVVDLVTATKLGLHYPALPRYPQPDGKVKLAAGWLIEQAGWKGRNLGPVGMYERQALVLVNHEPGQARSTDVGWLAEAVRVDVKRRFGVSLVPEPIFV